MGEPLVPPPIAEGARHPSRRAVKELTVHLQAVLQDLFDRAQRKAGVEVPVNQTTPAGRVRGMRETAASRRRSTSCSLEPCDWPTSSCGDRAAAEDVAAEALARTYARWSKVSALPYRDGWVLKVATNLAIDRLRRRPPDVRPAPADDFEDGVELRLALNAALLTLAPRQREAVALHYLGGLSDREVAQALGISLGSVKTHIHRGIKCLRARLGGSLEEVTPNCPGPNPARVTSGCRKSSAGANGSGAGGAVRSPSSAPWLRSCP